MATLENEVQSRSTVDPSVLQERLKNAREDLSAKTISSQTARVGLARYSQHVDKLIKQLHEMSTPLIDSPVTLVALGGYGRQQLCLHSDIDLLILFGHSVSAKEEKFLKSLLHPLWDLRLEVGHHVRDLSDLRKANPDNPEFLVSLCDARYLAGDRSLFKQLTGLCLGSRATWRIPILESLQRLLERRYSQFNETLYHLEPDIKSSPGSLRDISAIRTINLLTGSPSLSNIELERVDEAEDFFLRIRSILHLERQRNLNVLTHELQDTVARAFGYPGEKLARQVETLMSTYFHHARIINRALKASQKILNPEPSTPVHRISEGLERCGNQIFFVDVTRASLRPRTWLAPFKAALEYDCSVSDQVLTCIERHGERYTPERFFPTQDQRDQLLQIFTPKQGLYSRLSEMHDSGLLRRLFPEFQKAYCLVVRDFYHKYTVDEHTLQTIRNLESLCNPTTHSRKRFGELLTELQAPSLLVLALLFHDVGKGTKKDHSEEGAKLARRALKRVKLPEEDILTVEFLIRNHLQMSKAAFRRDAEDPSVVKQFSKLFGTEEHLKLLCLLTLVDVEAVGPDVMTTWKEELLWQLYVDTYNRLTLGYGDEIINPAKTSLAELQTQKPSNVDQQGLDRFLDGLPQRYLRLVNNSTIYTHFQMAQNLNSDDVHCSLEQQGTTWELTVVSIDQPKLYSKICGVLSYFGMDILRGQAMSNHQGVALDIFQFTDHESFLKLNVSAKDELVHRLKEVVAGRENIDKILRPREAGLSHKKPLRVKSVVHVDNQYSEQFSILEMVAANSWGLLYRISRLISHQGCDIDLVLASTEGTRAIDVFHLTKNGAKLTNEESESLSTNIEMMLQDSSNNNLH
tara:strand:- start:3124 stop:5700 length:2577 start_codon:yes stop_codon:yes gene_type:complete